MSDDLVDEAADERIRSALASWAGARHVDPPTAAQIRTRGTGRVRRNRAAAAVTSIAAAAALALVLLVPSGARPAHHESATGANGSARLAHLVADLNRLHPADAAAKAAAAAADGARFTAALTRAEGAAAHGSNVAFSPTSLDEVLTELALGARRTTASQLERALGAPAVSASAQAARWNALSAAISSAATSSRATYDDRSGIFIRSGLSVRAGYLDDLARQFGDGIWRAEFATDPRAAAKAIARWADSTPGGPLPALPPPGSITNRTALVVANALGFAASWSSAATFLAARTTSAPFHLASGASVEVPTMHLRSILPAVSTRALTAVELPYRGDRFSALVIEPTGSSLSSLLAKFSPTTISSIVASLRSARTTLSLPKLSLSSSVDLDSALSSLGITDAFGSAANFGGITSTPIALGVVSQGLRLTVNESGTNAATSTAAVGQVEASRRLQVTADVDHPFIFLVRDDATGAVLFEALVENPRQP